MGPSGNIFSPRSRQFTKRKEKLKMREKHLWSKQCRAVLVSLVLVLLFAFPAQAAAKASIRLNAKSITLTEGKTKKLKATVRGKSKKVVFSSSNRSVATVSSAGKVTAKNAGTAVITAKANGKTAKCTVKVKAAPYKEIYSNILSQNVVKVNGHSFTPRYFYLLNVDKKGVPELIVSDIYGPGIVYHVFTVKNGKSLYLGNCTLRGTAEAYIKYSSKYKGIYCEGWINGVGGSYSYLYGISGKKLVLKQHCTEYHSPNDSYYTGKTEKQSQKVSKSKYLSFYNQYFKSLKKYKMKSNTAANRRKYL